MLAHCHRERAGGFNEAERSEVSVVLYVNVSEPMVEHLVEIRVIDWATSESLEGVVGSDFTT